MYHSKITGLGFYVPDNIVTNDDLSKIIETNDEWIRKEREFKSVDILLLEKTLQLQWA